jgi:hypothetical protein
VLSAAHHLQHRARSCAVETRAPGKVKAWAKGPQRTNESTNLPWKYFKLINPREPALPIPSRRLLSRFGRREVLQCSSRPSHPAARSRPVAGCAGRQPAPAPIVFNSQMFERATRLCRTSPQIATVSAPRAGRNSARSLADSIVMPPLAPAAVPDEYRYG